MATIATVNSRTHTLNSAPKQQAFMYLPELFNSVLPSFCQFIHAVCLAVFGKIHPGEFPSVNFPSENIPAEFLQGELIPKCPLIRS